MTSSVSGTISWWNCKFSFEFMNNVNTKSNIRFTMSFSNEVLLEFFDMHRDEKSKICVDVLTNPTNSFTYVSPFTFYPKKNINNVPKDTALRFRMICNTDGKFEIRSYEYQNYVIARNCKLTFVK